MSTPHKATPEQWEDAGAFASDTRAVLLELRDRITALEQFRESTAAHSLAMGEAMNQATASIAVLEASIAVLEQRVGAPVRMADRVAELRAALQRLALKGGKVTLPEICDVFEQWGRRLAAPASAPATEPAPAPTRSLVDAVEARAGGDARSAIREVVPGEAPVPAAEPAPGTTLHSYSIGEAKPIEDWGKGHTPATAPAPAGSLVERVAEALDSSCPQDEYVINDCRAAIREVADWLQRRHTGRIANGSQFAELLRQEAER